MNKKCIYYLFLLQLVAGRLSAQSYSYSLKDTLLEPRIFAPGVISTGMDELNACFSPDGNTLFFSLNATDNKFGVIMMSEYKNKKWSLPVKAPFSSGKYTDYDPFISADGRQLFFISNRPVAGYKRKNFDIYLVNKQSDGKWDSAAINLGKEINDEGDQYYPSLARNGNLYFSTRKDTTFDLHCSKYINNQYSSPVKLPGKVNMGSQGTAEIDNCISPDESFIVFAGYGRREGRGNGDLYISFNQDGIWSDAHNLGDSINSKALEYAPILSPDGNYLFYTSKKGIFDTELETPIRTYTDYKEMLFGLMNGLGNLYQVRFDKSVIEGLRKRVLKN